MFQSCDLSLPQKAPFSGLSYIIRCLILITKIIKINEKNKNKM